MSRRRLDCNSVQDAGISLSKDALRPCDIDRDFHQEEALCYSSTLYQTLRPEWYPWPNLGLGSVAGIFSPNVVVFKDDLDHDCVDLPVEDRVVVSVITVAAPCRPELTSDKSAFQFPEDVRDLQGKIRLVLRIAARNVQDRLVLGEYGDQMFIYV